MGCTGSGHLSDYLNYKKTVAGVTGSKDNIHICERVVATILEDMTTGVYFRTSGTVLSKSTPIVISFNKSIIVVDDNGLTIGFLPAS